MISRNFKNVLVVSVGFLSLFTAYGGLQSLQVGDFLLIITNLLDLIHSKKVLLNQLVTVLLNLHLI